MIEDAAGWFIICYYKSRHVPCLRQYSQGDWREGIKILSPSAADSSTHSELSPHSRPRSRHAFFVVLAVFRWRRWPFPHLTILSPRPNWFASPHFCWCKNLVVVRDSRFLRCISYSSHYFSGIPIVSSACIDAEIKALIIACMAIWLQYISALPLRFSLADYSL